MPLQPIKLRPGINRQNTNYASEGGYYACDKVRFRNGMPEKIGGWTRYSSSTVIGTVRALFNWGTINRTNLLAVGTNRKYYIESNGGMYDITPVRRTVTLSDNAFLSEAGSAIIIVSDSAHNAGSGDFVTFSGVVGFAGLDAAVFNREFPVTVLSGTTYSIDLGTPALTTASGGGSAISAAYQINGGLDVAIPGAGYGAGSYGRGTYGSATDTVVYSSLRLWSQEAWGEDHVFCTRGGAIYYFDYSHGLATRAVALADMVGASEVPLMATKLLMSTADRHLCAYGCNAIGDTEQDPLLVRWCDTENLLEWTPSLTNAAGDFRLGTGNAIVTAVHTKQETLVFTDGQIYSQQFIGAPYIFGFTPVAENISIISAAAAAVANNTVFWMGQDKFYRYAGTTMTLPCALQDYVFNDINQTQAAQVFSGTNEGFSEVWWFYCSAASNAIDRYVIFNYDENCWYYGSLKRTAWLDSPMKPTPVAAMDNILFFQENGLDDVTAPLAAFIESADFDMGEGDALMYVSCVIPDMKFDGSTATTPTALMTLTSRQSPSSDYENSQTAGVDRPLVIPVGQFSGRRDVRLRGRQAKIRIESVDVGVHWKLGNPRLEVKPDGRK